MILDKKINIKVTSSNKKRLESFGYNCENKNIDIKVEDLSKSSHYKINVKCTHCSIEKKVVFKNYMKSTDNNTNKYYCNKCSKHKVKANNLKKYGVISTTQLEQVKSKIKQTNLEKYGFEYSSQSEEVKSKIKQTNLERYGSEYYLQSIDKKDKTKQTNLERYGFEYSSQSEEVKSKIKQTNLERYGSEYSTQSEKIKSKIKKTNLERYGSEYATQSEEIKSKTKQTNMEKYGVEYVTQSEEIKFKIKKTNIERYGNTHTLSIKKTKENRRRGYSNWNKNTMLKTYNLKLDDCYEVLSYDDNTFKILHKVCDNIFESSSKMIYERLKRGSNCCTICNPIDSLSYPEVEISEWLNSYGVVFEKNNKTVLKGKHLDFYIPDKKIAIEYNGLYYHSELFKDRNYHLNKTNICKENNIHLIHIWEDEWLYKKDIIKSIIINQLGINKTKIYARKCNIKEISSKISKEFLNENHIQGFTPSTVKLGLYHEKILVSVMTFGQRKTNNKQQLELIRFCNRLDHSIVGSMSKLFKFFLKKYNTDNREIVSYSDNRLFDGSNYNLLGFKKNKKINIEYYWCKHKTRHNRYKFNKKKLISDGYDSKKSGNQIMLDRGYYRIYGCGQTRWEYSTY